MYIDKHCNVHLSVYFILYNVIQMSTAMQLWHSLMTGNAFFFFQKSIELACLFFYIKVNLHIQDQIT